MFRDGYSRHVTIETQLHGKLGCWFRPITANEWKFFHKSTRFLKEYTARTAMSEMVETHIEPGSNDIEHEWSSILQFSESEPEAFNKLWRTMIGILPDTTGRYWAEDERKWRHNLYEGIILLRKHPKLSNRSCESCQKFWYNETTGDVIMENSTLLPMLREGDPICRDPMQGCPKGTPEFQRSLNNSNRWTLSLYQECVSVGMFPSDALFQQSCSIVKKALEVTLK